MTTSTTLSEADRKEALNAFLKLRHLEPNPFSKWDETRILQDYDEAAAWRTFLCAYELGMRAWIEKASRDLENLPTLAKGK